jgi:hypothetical protein
VEHLGFDGLFLPPGHAFWRKFYPPSDWGCSCYVVGARSERAAAGLGGKPSKMLPAGWDAINPKTGEPHGIGKGWGYAPGASVAQTVNAMAKKLDEWPLPVAVAAARDWLNGRSFAKWIEKPFGTWPVARIPDEAAQQIGSTVKVASLSAETMVKQKAHHPELNWTDYRLTQEIIDRPDHVIQDGERSLVYVALRPDDDHSGGHVFVIKATRSGEGLFVISFRRLSRDVAERDRAIARLLRKRLPREDGRR